MTGTTFQLYLLIVNLKTHKTYPYKLPKDVDFRSHKKISGCTKKIMKGIGHTCAYASGRKSKANPARGFMFHRVYASHYVSTQITQQCGTILPSPWFLFFHAITPIQLGDQFSIDFYRFECNDPLLILDLVNCSKQMTLIDESFYNKLKS